MTGRTAALLALLVAAAAVPARPAPAPQEPAPQSLAATASPTPAPAPPPSTVAAPVAAPAMTSAEVVYYTWRLEGFVGTLAGLFLPNNGEGTLTTRPVGGDHVESVLLITSPSSKAGEYWTYGAEITRDGHPVRTWSSYLWRGEKKDKEGTVDESGVVDIASGIYRIRHTLPRQPERMRIWSDGKLYPVLVSPLGEQTRRLPGGPVRTRHFRIEGLQVAGERFWEGKLDLWLAMDAAATPVEILVERKWARVRLERTAASPGAGAPARR